MVPGIDRVDATPLPLPESAWRITSELKDCIRRALMGASRFIIREDMVDNDYRHWRIHLPIQTIDVLVDSEVDPGKLIVRVHGEGAEIYEKRLLSYQRLPILKISRALNARQLINDFPNQRVMRTLAKTDRLKLAVRSRIRQAKYKIVEDKAGADPVAWALSLKTGQQLQIASFANQSGDTIMVDAFGTMLDRLIDLMDIFDGPR